MIEAICFDLGDTLVAEETVIHNSYGQAITAKVIEGVFEVLEAMRKDGYRTAMIANANSADARNIIATCGLEDYFDVIVISEEVGIEKPDKQVFKVALDKLGVEAENAVMVGNRIDADIVGANRIGMKSVWFKWNNRYPASVNTKEEEPDFTISNLSDLNAVLGLL